MCGIWGIVNTKPRKFDYTTFCILGIANDTRGGDSCGYFIDGHYEYGAKDDKKWFQCFFPENEFLKTCFESTIAFGHCRKASVGKIDETTAQPVVITNKHGQTEYVLMHNGTIHNYAELAKKYIPKEDITGLTDSQVMARIFYYKGYDVLNEYEGGAVFAIADYRYETPKILLFKGASKKTKNSKEQSEERPLYFCVDSEKEELIFSSISSYLMALRPNLTTWDLLPNKLCEFNGKDLIPIKEYTRDSVYQNKEIVLQTYYNDYYNFYYSKYVTLNNLTNTYSNSDGLLQGKHIISSFGELLKTYDKYSTFKEIYFWNGIALKNKACYNFISTLRKKYQTTDQIFDSKFNNLIRYLSVDGIFNKLGKWYKAISPTKFELFTGTLHMLTSSSYIDIKEGNQGITSFNSSSKRAFESLNSNMDRSFKEILKECKSLMKSINNG